LHAPKKGSAGARGLLERSKKEFQLSLARLPELANEPRPKWESHEIGA
jgi:hypothetical protein